MIFTINIQKVISLLKLEGLGLIILLGISLQVLKVHRVHM